MNNIDYYIPQYNKIIEQLVIKTQSLPPYSSQNSNNFSISGYLLSKNSYTLHESIKKKIVTFEKNTIKSWNDYTIALQNVTDTDHFWQNFNSKDNFFSYFLQIDSSGINTLQFQGLGYYLMVTTNLDPPPSLIYLTGKMLNQFERFGRLFDAYGPDLKRQSNLFENMFIYIFFSLVLLELYQRGYGVHYLSCALKVCDMFCFAIASIKDQEKAIGVLAAISLANYQLEGFYESREFRLSAD